MKQTAAISQQQDKIIMITIIIFIYVYVITHEPEGHEKDYNNSNDQGERVSVYATIL
jgi:hypothetical protein